MAVGDAGATGVLEVLCCVNEGREYQTCTVDPALRTTIFYFSKTRGPAECKTEFQPAPPPTGTLVLFAKTRAPLLCATTPAVWGWYYFVEFGVVSSLSLMLASIRAGVHQFRGKKPSRNALVYYLELIDNRRDSYTLQEEQSEVGEGGAGNSSQYVEGERHDSGPLSRVATPLK